MGKVVEDLLKELDGILLGDISFISFKSAMDIFDENTIYLVIAEANRKTEEVEHFATRVIISLTVATEIVHKLIDESDDLSPLMNAFSRIVSTYSSEINSSILTQENQDLFKDKMIEALCSVKDNEMDVDKFKPILLNAANYLLEGVSNYPPIKEVLDLAN